MTHEIKAKVFLGGKESGGRIHPPENPFRSQFDLNEGLTVSVLVHVESIPQGGVIQAGLWQTETIKFTTIPDNYLDKIEKISDFQLTEGSKIIGRGSRLYS